MTLQYGNFGPALARYGATLQSRSSDQAALVIEYARFLDRDPQAFERSNAFGHFTGSALVVDPRLGRVLLTHHAKMEKWLQLGGHCDGIRDPFFVAWKEAYEEGGLKLITPASSDIFDLSLHTTPNFKDVPEHYHYDVRYLFYADSCEAITKSDESIDLAWVELGQVRRYTQSKSMLRLEMKAIHHLEWTHGYERPSGYVEPSSAGAEVA
ncbi:NUDIX hydrolase [Agrobacterium rubi]|nr:NUDIX hydrolase [Agrobacterium rubi]NTF24445.1 NUDIX hydrolase [Agrobacterium rubi]